MIVKEKSVKVIIIIIKLNDNIIHVEITSWYEHSDTKSKIG